MFSCAYQFWAKIPSTRLAPRPLDGDSSPWLVGGDFNEITHPAEHSASTVTSFTPHIVLSLQQPTCPNFAAEKELRDKLNMLRRVEEEYFKQLSRINWLKCGDLNTSYFQKVAKARKAYNTITILIGMNGFEATSPEDIGNIAVSHFQSILGPPTHKTSPVLISQVADMIRTDRNERLHRGNHRSLDQIIAKTTTIIKNRISAMRPENNSLASDLMQYWFLHFP
ncbi:unnamed protein product [Brassica oleracea var. botrytis]|uniref:Endonuclease/exonuclease/phosphatase domain-containing protein n=1 Tax=Brassica oleracea TaxID=3712 RepID=A0A3P6CMH1_BRAOL|nr:unnamed protein product [Brassica oleracea]